MIILLKICCVFVVGVAIIVLGVVIEKYANISVMWAFGFWSYPIIMGIVNYKIKGDTK